jgi:hypothetical protein
MVGPVLIEPSAARADRKRRRPSIRDGWMPDRIDLAHGKFRNPHSGHRRAPRRSRGRHRIASDRGCDRHTVMPGCQGQSSPNDAEADKPGGNDLPPGGYVVLGIVVHRCVPRAFRCRSKRSSGGLGRHAVKQPHARRQPLAAPGTQRRAGSRCSEQGQSRGVDHAKRTANTGAAHTSTRRPPRCRARSATRHAGSADLDRAIGPSPFVGWRGVGEVRPEVLCN